MYMYMYVYVIFCMNVIASSRIRYTYKKHFSSLSAGVVECTGFSAEG